MKFSIKSTAVFRMIKLVVLGSAVATRTATGSPAPESALDHELAWLVVRERTVGNSASAALPDDVRYLVACSFSEDFEYRVKSSYRSALPDGIATLDELWMDTMLEGGADFQIMDRFLAARTTALSEMGTPGSTDVDAAGKLARDLHLYKAIPYDGSE